MTLLILGLLGNAFAVATTPASTLFLLLDNVIVDAVQLKQEINKSNNKNINSDINKLRKDIVSLINFGSNNYENIVQNYQGLNEGLQIFLANCSPTSKVCNSLEAAQQIAQLRGMSAQNSQNINVLSSDVTTVNGKLIALQAAIIQMQKTNNFNEFVGDFSNSGVELLANNLQQLERALSPTKGIVIQLETQIKNLSGGGEGPSKGKSLSKERKNFTQ